MHVRSSFLCTLALAVAFALSGCQQDYSIYKNPDPAALEYGVGSGAALISKTGSEAWQKVSVFDVGRAPLGSVSRSYVDIRNTGEMPAAILGVSIDNDGSFQNPESQCGAAVLPGERCRIFFNYAPDTIGSTPGKMNVRYNDGYDREKVASLPIQASANNLAFLKFEVDSIDIHSDTVGYTLSALFKVLYNGTIYAKRGISILPAKGVVIAEPTDGSFKLDSTATTCGETIDQDCYIQVNFSPTNVGPKSAAFSLGYFNGSEVLKIIGQVQGTGVAAVQLATLSASNANFGNVVANPVQPVGMSIPVTFSGSVTATSVVITGPAAGAFSLSTDPNKTTCKGGTISGSCSLYVSFNPTAIQSYSDAISITYRSNSQDRPKLTIQLSGAGVAPAKLASSAQSLDFGSLPAHKPSQKYFTLTNNGGVPISSLSAISLSDATDFSASFDSSCATLAPGASCRLNLAFKPQSAASLSTGIRFTYFDGRATQQLDFTAAGNGSSPLVLEGGGTVDFGNVMLGYPQLPSRSVGIAVYGTTPASNASQVAFQPSQLSSPYSLTAGSCKAPLNPNQVSSCSFNVDMTTTTGFPVDTPVTQNFSLAYAGDGNNGSGTLSFSAKMTLRNPPVLAFNAAQSVFPTVSVRDSSTIQLTITNQSPYFATAYRSMSLSGDSSFSISGTNCQGGLSPGASCLVYLRFQPSSSGHFAGSIQYTYSNQISDQQITSSFSADASTKITLKTNTTTVDFGSVFVGDPIPDKIISLSVFGTDSWSVSSDAGSPYSIQPQGCGGSSDCKLVVSFNPSAPATFNSTVTVTYSPGLPNPARLVFQLRGSASNRAPVLGVSPTQFPKTLVGQQAVQTIDIRNNGNTTADNLGIQLQSADGSFAFTSDGGPGGSGNCAAGQSLAVGASCHLKIAFSPAQVGSLSASLNLTLNGVNSNFTLNGKGTQMLQVSAGGYQTCLINEFGSLLCWGRNSSGQAGRGDSNAINQKPQDLTPVSFGQGIQVQKVAVGDSHTCAILSSPTKNGLVTCWGSNESGRLGLGTTEAKATSPLSSGQLRLVNLGTNEEAIDIAAGFEHTCALLKSSKIKCWGGNTSGQLGVDSSAVIGTSGSQMGDALQAVNLGLPAMAVSAGAGHTCATMVGGKSKCWGDNFYGQLGQGRTDEKIGNHSGDMASLKNIVLANSFDADATLASNGAFTCAKTVAGVVKCFGKAVANEKTASPFWGVLGNCYARSSYNAQAGLCSDNPSTSQATSIGYLAGDMGQNLPVVSLPVASKQLSVGTGFVCSLGTDATVRCWGLNDRGQLGTGSNQNAGTKASEMGSGLATALSNAYQIAAGYEHACAVQRDNTLRCWGASSSNATGLAAFGISSDAGGSSSTAPSALPIVYDGR